METSETLAHGCIILTQSTREALTTHQMEVVSVGEPAICEDEECERPHVWEPIGEPSPSPLGIQFNALREHAHGLKPGQWVLVKHRGLSETHQEGMYCAHQDDIQAILVVDAKP